MSDSAATAWAQSLSSLSIKVVHESERRLPAPEISSRMPCHYLKKRTVASATVKGKDAQQLFDLLVAAQRADSSRIRLMSACPNDSSHWDTMKLEFRGGNEPYYRGEVSLDQGSYVLVSPEGPSRYCMLASRAAPFLEMARKALPEDAALGAWAICDRTAPDTLGMGAVGSVWVERLPEVINRVPPDYPESARSLSRQGTVLVEALISPQGNVLQTMILQSVDGLDEAAVRCVEQWDFRPAIEHGRPVTVWIVIPIRFGLQ